MLVLALLVPPPCLGATAEGEPATAAARPDSHRSSTRPPGPLLASGLRLAAAADAQAAQRLPRGFRCGVGIPLATAAGAMVGLTAALVAALADLGTPPEGRTRVLLAAGAGVGLAVGIYGCTR